ncbi:ATP-binding cassette domain-containing protein [Candidatus Soleaferrea massiliensis]|uniref:ATP-binding cassette domain-containing protein n=1 Tax=Candidatus Soleaferrea massiliensis TaxID=1470354 RepID=UPI0009E5A3D4|nr:ATP-binding cassette domain-containing protein [Candidatus Soleaferrea massiliensis]
MKCINLKSVSKKSYEMTDVLNNASISFESSAIHVVLSSNAESLFCLLKVISGLDTVMSGKIYIDEADVTAKHARDRGVAVIFKQSTLYPNMTVLENIKSLMGVDRTIDTDRINYAVKLLKIEDILSEPAAELSAYNRLMVLLAKAIIKQPKAILIEEALQDVLTEDKNSVKSALKTVQKALDCVILCTTVKNDGILDLAEKLTIIEDGVVLQSGEVREVLSVPKNVHVAQILGSPQFHFYDGSIKNTKDGAYFCYYSDSSIKLRVPDELVEKAAPDILKEDVVLCIEESKAKKIAQYPQSGTLYLFNKSSGKNIAL